MLEPGPLDALLPELARSSPAICVPATRDEFSFLTRTGRTRLPTPPQMANHGNFIISLGQLTPLLGAEAERLGVDVFAGFAAAEALFDDAGAVRGVRIGDMGVEKTGEPGPNFAPGPEIHARLTVFAEGCRGSVSKQLIRRYRLDSGKSPQTYGLGIKELWQLPPGRCEPGLIQHTLGWPLDDRTYGGSFLYHLNDDRAYLGFVVGLDYEDPRFKPFEAFQQFKNHPSVRGLLEGGDILAGGARTVIEGGYQSMPTLEMPGALLVGDAGGTLNTPKIKGIHQAIRCGMTAAEHYAEARLRRGFRPRWRDHRAAANCTRYATSVPGSVAGCGGARQCRARDGDRRDVALDPRESCGPHRTAAARRVPPPERGWGDRELPPRDRLAFVFFAATTHDENQPVHLHVAETSCCIALPASSAIPARISARPTCMRWSMTRAAAEGCRSIHPIACIARRVTSRNRTTGRSPGCRLKADRAPNLSEAYR